MSSGELDDAAMSWIEPAAAEEFLSGIPWNITDDRFKHSISVVDIVIDSIQFDAVHSGYSELTVYAHETE